MKRLTTYRGHSVRSLFLTAVAVGCVAFILVMGVVQALAATHEGVGGRMLTLPTGHTTIHVFPSMAVARKVHSTAGQRCEKEYCPTPPLLYWGGKGVQHGPQVFLILWGSNWNKTGTPLNSELLKMYLRFSTSKYQGILTQYFDSTSRVGTTVKAMSFTDTSVTAPTSVTKVKIQEEVLKAIKENKLPNTSENEFVIVPAPGTTYAAGFGAEFCGYHGLTEKEGANFTFVAYMSDEPFKKGCLSYDKAQNVSNVTRMIASHEYAESVTDPDPKSVTWVTSDGYEIGDICIKEDDEILEGLWGQGLWDNYQNICSLSDPSPAFVYAITEPAIGITSSGAELVASINPESLATKYSFEYGLTTSYTAKLAEVSAGSGRSTVEVKEATGPLSGKTTYHFRVVAINSTGTAYGRDREFKTT